MCVCVWGKVRGGGWPCSMQNFPDKGLNPCRLQWKHIVLTTRPPRVSILTASYSFSYDSVFYVLGGGGDIQGDGEGRVWSLSGFTSWLCHITIGKLVCSYFTGLVWVVSESWCMLFCSSYDLWLSPLIPIIPVLWICSSQADLFDPALPSDTSLV